MNRVDELIGKTQDVYDGHKHRMYMMDIMRMIIIIQYTFIQMNI